MLRILLGTGPLASGVECWWQQDHFLLLWSDFGSWTACFKCGVMLATRPFASSLECSWQLDPLLAVWSTVGNWFQCVVGNLTSWFQCGLLLATECTASSSNVECSWQLDILIPVWSAIDNWTSWFQWEVLHATRPFHSSIDCCISPFPHLNNLNISDN